MRRAEGKLGQAKVELTWANDEKAQCQLESVDTFNHGNEPKATYLSQQFVDKLCASDEIADDLLREMERVIFESHAFATRGAAHDFNSLKTAKVGSSSNQRRDAERAIADLSERIADALEVKCKIPLVREKIQHQQGVIANYETDKQNLAPSGSDENQTRFNQINEAINNANLRIAGLTEKKSALEDLQNEVKCFRQEFAREMLHDLKSSFAIADLSDDEWKEFGTDFIGDVDNLLKGKLEPLKKQIKDQQGSPVCLPTDDGDDSTALIQDLADLDKQPLSLLAAEADRLSRILGENKAADDRFKTVLDRLRRETRNLQGLKAELREYQDKEGQIQELAQQRSNKLGIVIKAVLAEENALHSIYKPLAKKLQNSDGVLRKLTFSVKRHIDLEDWAKRGEDLLDLRSAGKFRFKGTLVNRAKQELAGIWQTGNETEILKALNKFQTCHRDNLLKHSPYQQGTAEHRDWLTQFAKWIFDTSYVSFQYSMAYDGTDIRQLSPGNRGIVMLLLYLELDENNGKPLIIDQPEENLDPKSIQSELVPLFERAKKRRQIFMVTHNANLVVNTDAEQVIVANLGAREKDKLPPISYESGGLEDASIREKVCEVLEGGEAAFKERAKRLQITLSR